MREILLKAFKTATKPFLGSGIGKYRPIAKLYAAIAGYVIPDNKRIVEVNGYKLNVHQKNDGISMQLLLTGGYEPYETGLFKNVVKEGHCVIDIGANIGYYTLLAASLVGTSGKVYAFEPHPKNFELLKKNVLENRFENVVVCQNAVTDMNGEIKLFIGLDHGTHSLDNVRCTTQESIQIQGCSLDNFFHGDVKPDIIKMDIQGAETKALRGMSRMLGAAKDVILFTECEPEMLGDLELFWKELENCGFKYIYLIDDRKKSLIPASLGSVDEHCKKNKYANLLCAKRQMAV